MSFRPGTLNNLVEFWFNTPHSFKMESPSMSRGAEFPRKIGVMIRPNKRKVMHKVVGVGANPGIINKSSIEAFKIAMW